MSERDPDAQPLIYIINTGHTATVKGFDEDHEPIGPTLRKHLSRYFVETPDGGLQLNEAGMERALNAMYGRR